MTTDTLSGDTLAGDQTVAVTQRQENPGIASMLLSMLGLCRALPFDKPLTNAICNVLGSLEEVERCDVQVPPRVRTEHRDGRNCAYVVRCDGEPVMSIELVFASLKDADATHADMINALSILGTVLENKSKIEGLNQTIARNAEQLQQVNEALREQVQAQQRLVNIVRITSNAVVITNADREIIWVNDAFEKVSGYTQAEALGKKPGKLLQCEDTDPETIAFMQEQLEKGQGFRTTLLNQSKQGRKYWLDLDVHPIKDSEGKIQEFISVQSDVTELKLGWEAAQESNELKRQFIATLNHEIRTPLNPVIAMAEFIEHAGDTLPRAKMMEYIHDIAMAGRSMREIIDGMLNFTRLERDLMQLPVTPMLLGPLVERSARLFRKSAENKGLTLKTEGTSLLTTALCETGAFQQIIGNLLTNAIKYTPEGGTVTLSVAEDGRDRVKVTVNDTGIGIPDAYRDRVFEPFFRVKDPATAGEQGVGIGLATVKLLADKLDGKLSVESTQGEGTAFSLSLARASKVNAAK